MTRAIFTAVVFSLYGSVAIAADTSKPDATSIVNAMYAAVNVGNVDAAVSFFAEDGYFILPAGRKYTGKDALRGLIGEIWIPEQVRIGLAKNVNSQDDKTVVHFDIATRWGNALGIPSSEAENIIYMEGNKIKGINGYYTSRSINKMSKACDAKPDVKMPNGAPCAKGIAAVKSHLDDLIAQGLAVED